MGKLIYAFNTSLDGYIEDGKGSLDWSEPDEEVHRLWNSFEASISLHLYGRRLYETMRFWEDPPADAGLADYALEYGRIWRASEKVVYSTALSEPTTARTRLERAFDPTAVARMKAESAADMSIGGAELAAHAIRAGLVDEYRTVVAPVILGGGKPWLPEGVRVDLELIDQRALRSGAVYLAYAMRGR